MATTKRFRIKDEVFEFATAADVTLRDLLLVEKETRELGHEINMGECTRLGELFENMDEAEAEVHPEGGWMLAITIWMAKIKKLRDAGDHTTLVSFEDAVTFNLGDFHPIADPADRQAPSGKAKKATRKASPRAGANAAGSGSTPD